MSCNDYWRIRGGAVGVKRAVRMLFKAKGRMKLCRIVQKASVSVSPLSHSDEVPLAALEATDDNKLSSTKIVCYARSSITSTITACTHGRQAPVATPRSPQRSNVSVRQSTTKSKPLLIQLISQSCDDRELPVQGLATVRRPSSRSIFCEMGKVRFF